MRSGDILLIRLCRIGGTFPPSLATLLASDALVAVGVGVGHDLRLLRRLQWSDAGANSGAGGPDDATQQEGTHAGGKCVELAQLAAKKGIVSEGNGQTLGLRALCQRVLGKDLLKDRYRSKQRVLYVHYSGCVMQGISLNLSCPTSPSCLQGDSMWKLGRCRVI